jgi:hypothetical protein
MGDPIDKGEWQKSKNKKNITNSNNSSHTVSLKDNERKHKRISTFE